MTRRFNRFELKYLLSVGQRDAIRAELRERMRKDSFGDNDGTYRVTSLYYDSPKRACFEAKLDGLLYRRKVRVRVYAEHAESDAHSTMVEIKQRINLTVQKRRLILPLAQANALCGSAELPQGLTNALDTQVVGEIAFLSSALCLKPAAVITYLREAWVGGENEPGLRITFDGRIGVRQPDNLLFAGPRTRQFLSDEWCVLEVKADNRVPLWVTNLIGRHSLRLQRISKYCAGLVALRGQRPYDLIWREQEPAISPLRGPAEDQWISSAKSSGV